MRCAIWRGHGSAIHSPGWVGSGTPGDASCVRNSTVTLRARALCASEVKVRTTPFACGCQASVAIRTRIPPLALGTAVPSHYRIACDKIAILISQPCDGVALAITCDV